VHNEPAERECVDACTGGCAHIRMICGTKYPLNTLALWGLCPCPTQVFDTAGWPWVAVFAAKLVVGYGIVLTVDVVAKKATILAVRAVTGVDVRQPFEVCAPIFF
jgi:hypothetical protein